LQGVEDVGTDNLVSMKVDARNTAGFLDPFQILRREFVAMLTEKINAILLLHVLERVQVE
jgi:hypothetical protein